MVDDKRVISCSWISENMLRALSLNDSSRLLNHPNASCLNSTSLSFPIRHHVPHFVHFARTPLFEDGRASEHFLPNFGGNILIVLCLSVAHLRKFRAHGVGDTINLCDFELPLLIVGGHDRYDMSQARAPGNGSPKRCLWRCCVASSPVLNNIVERSVDDGASLRALRHHYLALRRNCTHRWPWRGRKVAGNQLHVRMFSQASVKRFNPRTPRRGCQWVVVAVHMCHSNPCFLDGLKLLLTASVSLRQRACEAHGRTGWPGSDCPNSLSTMRW